MSATDSGDRISVCIKRKGLSGLCAFLFNLKMSDIRRNIVLFKWDHFFGGMWPMTAVLAVYFQEITRSYAAAMSVFSLCSLFQAILEVPTGIFSDKIGRRQTLVLSAVSLIVCLTAWAAAGQFGRTAFLFAGALFWGLSDALMSGTLDALMFETAEESSQKQNFNLICAASRLYNQAGLFIGVLLGTGIMYFWSLQVLAWASIFPMIGQLVTALFYVNPKKEKTEPVTTAVHFKQACIRLWKNKKLRLFGLIEILDSSINMTIHRFEGLYFENLIAVWLINVVRAGKQLAGIISYAMVPHLCRFGSLKLLRASVGACVVLQTAALMINNIFSVVLMPLTNLFFGITATAKTDLLQKEFPRRQRATAGSVLSLLTAVFQAGFYYFIGFLADICGVRIALFCCVWCQLSVVWLGKSAEKRKNKKFC